MISAVVLTLNEERHLSDCLASLRWADEVLVLDSGSQDNTISIAQAAGARVEQRAFTHFGDQREAALRLACHPWLFFVDADERVPPALAKEVQQIVATAPSAWATARVRPYTVRGRPDSPIPVGWWVPRRNFFWGREVRHSGWAPDYQLRLLRVDAARYDPDQHVHEVATLDGPAGWLKEPLIHINYDSWDEFWHKQRSYARHEGAKLAAQGLRWKPWNIVLQPLRAFGRRYIEWEGWKDGPLGLRLALAMAWWEGVAYLELKRLSEGK
ncbi:MAG: glycosyltransferase family 2 protein [Ardenticatenaceae bacterium]